MTKDQLRHIFQSPFDSDSWQRMLLEIFGANRIRIVPQELDSDGNQKVQGYELGKILTPDGYTIGLYEFEIKFGHRIEMNRVGLRGLVKNFTGYFVDAALVVYHNREQWRLSFICDLQGEKTAPKRFTYVFGNPTETYRTAVDRIFPLADSDKSFDAIYDAFSVEKLSRDFFNEYKRQYKLFYDHLGGTEKWQRDYVKKLLGRLVFLQFLQKKGWLGADASAENKWKTGDRQYLQNLVRRHEGNEKFLSEVLSVLFFETLNNADRENEIADSILGANICIPYLNGGLFDRDESDLRHDIEFPYGLFRGLMEFFSHYNFTIDENDPDDSEVGIDPEMLGHIFENLLEDNKDKGAYYTPKEIVRYMSQESLIQYLRQHTEPERHEAVEQLVRNDKVDGIADKKFAERLNMLLKQVKVCDPAIGSGAFPMGILSEIYRCRRRLFGITDKSANRFDSADIKREIIQENIYGVDIEQGAVDIARLRFWLSLVVDEEKPQPLPNLDYKIMQGNSLLESFAGLPLDNLSEIHTSSVVQDLFSNDADVQFSEDIDRLTDDYFNTTDHVLKEELRNRIENQVKERIGYSINRQMEAKYETIEGLKRRLTANSPKSKYKVIERLERDYDRLLEKVAELEHISKDNRPYFLWHTYFKDVFDRGGFDIVIGNPPYIQLQNNRGYLAEQLATGSYDTYARTGDIYCIFYEQGIRLLKQGGIETYITSSKWMRAAYGAELRSFLAAMNPVVLIELGPGVFNATVDTNILLVEKNVCRNELNASRVNGKEDFQDMLFVPLAVDSCGLPWVIKSSVEESIDRKVQMYGTPLLCWDIEIYRGVLTGYNEAFIIDSRKREELIAEDANSTNLIKPLLRGRGIGRYVSESEELWIIFVPWHFPLHEDDSIRGASLAAELEFERQYPAVYQYLSSHKEGLSKRNRAETGIRYEWYALQRCAATYYEELSLEKIVWKRIGSLLRFCYDDTGSVVLDSTCFSSGPNSKYLTAVLNSKMGHYLLKDAPKTGTGDLLVSVQALEPVAIPQLSEIEREPLEDLVDRIIDAKKESKNADTSIYENEIDKLVYSLYHLTDEEIAYIENI